MIGITFALVGSSTEVSGRYLAWTGTKDSQTIYRNQIQAAEAEKLCSLAELAEDHQVVMLDSFDGEESWSVYWQFGKEDGSKNRSAAYLWEATVGNW